MTEPYRFAWQGSGMGHVWFHVWHSSLPQGRQEIEYVHESHLDPYYRRRFNGDDEKWQREIVQMVHVLRFAHDFWRIPMPRDLVEAFNAWRQAEHATWVAKLRAEPDRYGPLKLDDPILRPPPIVNGADWVGDRFVPWKLEAAAA